MAILVTAQRRSESVQDVPIAISAFNSEMVEGSGSTNITSLNGLAPNVVLQTQGLVANVPMISIRGMNTSDPDPNADPKVTRLNAMANALADREIGIGLDDGREYPGPTEMYNRPG